MNTQIPSNLNDLFNILVFILLCFLGVGARISYDVEIKNKVYTLKSFFNRFFITLVLCYIMEIFILGNKTFKSYYTQIILSVAFFSVDLIRFFTENFSVFILYILGSVNKVVKDGITSVRKLKDTEK